MRLFAAFSPELARRVRRCWSWDRRGRITSHHVGPFEEREPGTYCLNCTGRVVGEDGERES